MSKIDLNRQQWHYLHNYNSYVYYNDEHYWTKTTLCPWMQFIRSNVPTYEMYIYLYFDVLRQEDQGKP